MVRKRLCCKSKGLHEDIESRVFHDYCILECKNAVNNA